MTTCGTPISRNACTASADVCANVFFGNEKPYTSRMERASSSPPCPPLDRILPMARCAAMGRPPSEPPSSGKSAVRMREYRTIACAADTARSGTW